MQQSTRRSTRSGTSLASHMPTIPPMERPQKEKRSRPDAVQERQDVPTEVVQGVGTGRDGGASVAAVVVAHEAETLAQRRRLVPPHLERRAQGVREHEDRRVLGTFDQVV